MSDDPPGVGELRAFFLREYCWTCRWFRLPGRSARCELHKRAVLPYDVCRDHEATEEEGDDE